MTNDWIHRIAALLLSLALVVTAALRAPRPLVGLLTRALDVGVPLFDWNGRASTDSAVQGAAFPSGFAGLPRVATVGERQRAAPRRKGSVARRPGERSLLDVLAWRVRRRRC